MVMLVLVYAILLVCAAAGLGLGQQQPAVKEEAVFRSGVALVRVDAQGVQGRRVVDNRTRDDFQITDESRPQALEYFGREAEPLWVVLLDVSGSMHKRHGKCFT
jgi:Mg-chelatase subunit ChlD